MNDAMTMAQRADALEEQMSRELDYIVIKSRLYSMAEGDMGPPPNAAILPHKPFTEVTTQDWETVRGVVLDGALYLTRSVIESMVANKYGRILFFTGEGAFVGGNGRAHVSAAKMGLVGFARGLASEFAPHNIRVNVVSPGSIDTMRANPEWYQGRVPGAAGIPLGRQGKVDEIAATCLFLVSDDGGFITGQTIHVNGGTRYY